MISRELTPFTTIGSIIKAIEAEISLLSQLHILSQTESLILESQKLESLDEVVTRKELIVAELVSLAGSLTQKLQTGEPHLSKATFLERESLSSLKTEGLRLLDLIQEIDSSNRVRLEAFKNQSIYASHQLQQELRFYRAYDISQPQALSQFFEVAE